MTLSLVCIMRIRSSHILCLSIGLFLGTAVTVTAAAIKGSSIFSDIPAGVYYDQSVGDLYTAGIIKGYRTAVSVLEM